MTNNDISHEGIVESVEKGIVHVRIVQSSACASCKIASHCVTSESKEKIIDVQTSDYSAYEQGDRVLVKESVGVGAKAVVYGFVIPLCLMMAAIIVALTLFETSEGVAALCGILVLLPYYAVLYLLRDYMKKVMKFCVVKV